MDHLYEGKETVTFFYKGSPHSQKTIGCLKKLKVFKIQQSLIFPFLYIRIKSSYSKVAPIRPKFYKVKIQRKNSK